MKKVLISLGTTVFDELVNFFDVEMEGVDLGFQCPAQGRQPSLWPCYSYIDNFDHEVLKYNLIISHCGAGNVYSMLENEIKLCVIPNLVRKDKHQAELARYVKRNRYAYVYFLGSDRLSPKMVIEKASSYRCEKYQKDDFTMTSEILDKFRK